jgi:phosphatidylglycerol:prolipoprotein diacylglycerol transferase
VLPHLGPLPFPTSYGLLVALGLVVALLVIRRLAPRAGLEGQQAQDVVVWACLAGLVGAKLLLVLLEPKAFLADPAGVLFQGGVFYGGLIAAVATLIIVCWRRGIDPNRLGDACAPAVPLGHAFGRLGCFLAGCCWGKACELPWGVVYENHEAAAFGHVIPASTAVHPVQLYEALGNVLLAGAMYLLFRKRSFTGQVWWTYAALYAVMRFALEEFRGDARGAWFGGALSTSQVVALLAFAAAFVMLGVQWRRRDSGPSAPDGPPEAPAVEEPA